MLPGPGVIAVEPGADGAEPVAGSPRAMGSHGDRSPDQDGGTVDDDRLMGFGLLGMAAISAGVGVGFAVSSSRLADETRGMTQRDQLRHAELSKQVDEDRTAMLIGFAASAVFTSLGAWLVLSDEPPLSRPSGSGGAVGWSVTW